MLKSKIPAIIADLKEGYEVDVQMIESLYTKDKEGETITFGFYINGDPYTLSLNCEHIKSIIKTGKNKYKVTQ